MRLNRYISYIEYLEDLLDIESSFRIKTEEGCFYLDGSPCDEFSLKESSGSTSIPEKSEIYLDLTKYTDKLKGLEYFAIAHELRHLYQYAYINKNNDELSDIWKKEMDEYKDSDYVNYENQSIEIDANAFASVVMKTSFNVDVNVRCDQELLSRRINELDKQYRDLLPKQ